MIKTAKFLSIFFHPLFLSFFNFLFLLLLTPIKGAVLGFDITLFFLSIVVIPMFYTAAVIYNDNKEFSWAYLSDMAIHSRRKLLIYTVIYNLVVLLFVLNLNDIFFKTSKPMFASLIMGFVFSMILSFLMHLLNIKNSLHALTVAFYMCFGFIFAWKIPGMEDLIGRSNLWYIGMGVVNFLILCSVVWARIFLKAHTVKEIVFGILIGILSPVVLTLLTYGI